MPKVKISLSSKVLLEAHAPTGYLKGAEPAEPGFYWIELEPDTFEGLLRQQRLAVPPTIDQAIRNICGKWYGTA